MKKGAAHSERRLVKRGKLSNVWNGDEADDTDGSSVFRQAEADVAVERWLPAFGGGKKDGEVGRPNSTDDGVEKGGKREFGVSAVKLLNGFMKVNNAVEEGEDLGREGGDIADRPIVGIDHGQNIVHPSSMDKRPRQKGQEWDLLKRATDEADGGLEH